MRLFSILLFCSFTIAVFSGADWWQFRGPNGASVADAKLPVTINDDVGIAWKTEMPGKGPSSPIVVGDKVFVTCSGGAKQDQLFVVCVNANSGEIEWQRQFWATGHCYCHPLSANAAPTPASDGEHVYCFFSSNDLVCLDLDGNLVWYRGLATDYPKARNDAGMSSSLVVSNGTVVAQVESQGESFVAGINTATGETRWHVDRVKEASWASPIIVPAKDERPEMIVLQSQDRVTALRMADGSKVWEQEGRVGTIASSVFSGDQVYVPVDGTTVYDVDPSGQLKKAWNSPQLRASTSSLVVADDAIYALERGGIVSAFDGKSGERKWKARIVEGEAAQGGSWATPILANNHLYIFTQSGESRVVKVNDDGGEVVNEYSFGETMLGSPAVSGDAMYVRGDEHLWKIAN